VQGEDCLAVFGEECAVGFPMAGRYAVIGRLGALADGDTILYVICGTSASPAAKAALGLGARQIEAPGIVLVAGDLGIDEAVDGLMADQGDAGLASDAAGGLFRGVAMAEMGEDALAQLRRAVEFAAGPAPCPGALLGIGWLVADG